MWQMYNPNPAGRLVGDCAVRAVAKALNIDWETAFDLMADAAFNMADMPSSNSVWGAVLRMHGFRRYNFPDTCPACYTFADFARDNPKGVFVLGTGTHTACVKNGVIYDIWDSSGEVVSFAWYK